MAGPLQKNTDAIAPQGAGPGPEATYMSDWVQEIGRDGEIRTRDPLHPMQVRYQAALRPDERRIVHAHFFATGFLARSTHATCAQQAMSRG